MFPRPPHFAHTILLANDGTSGGGRISFSSSNHFPPSEPSVTTKPVTFPPGRGKLATKPLPTGSACRSKSVPSASSAAGLRARWLRRQRRHASLRQVATSRFTPSRRITMAGGRSQHALWPLLGPSLGSPILRGATVRAAGSHMRNERAIGLWSYNCCRLRPNCEALLLEGPSIPGAGPDHPSVTVSIGTNLGALQTNRPSPSPVRLSLGGCSLRFGRTSVWFLRAPHWCRRRAGEATAPPYQPDTSTRRTTGVATSIAKAIATSRCTPRLRMLPNVIGSPGGFLGFWLTKVLLKHLTNIQHPLSSGLN